VPVLRIDEALEGRQVERVRALRARRDKTKWESAIRAVEDAARGDQNLMPHIIHAVESYCTVGEISDTLRRVFGEYQETVVI
jgi:methylmalonyl-CoA mutase N-terminal domain/subunit